MNKVTEGNASWAVRVSVLCAICALLLSTGVALAEEPVATSPPPPDEPAVKAQGYEEQDALRELEREHIPEVGPSARSLEFGFGVPPIDRLSLEGQSPLELLLLGDQLTGGGPGRVARIAAEISPRLVDVLEQVELDLEKLDDKTRSEDGEIAYLPFGLDLTDEEAVKHYVALFTDPGSTSLKVWIRRSGRYKDTIEAILREEGVPVDLLYLAMIESGYRTQIRSRANAGGMWQFIPSTGHEYGLTINAYVDERFDPIKSTRAAATMLKKNYGRFGSWPLAMAAYNGGPGLISGTIKRFNSNHYFRLVDYGAMYEETRRYVPKIYAAALIAKNPEVFGYEGIVHDAPWQFDEVVVPGGVRLGLIADAAKTDVHTLRELNPELLQLETPPGEPYRLRLPVGGEAAFVENYDNLAKRYGDSHERYTLRFGETLDAVAKRVGIPARVLRQINDIDRRDPQPYGSTLLIPTQGRNPAEDTKKDEDIDPEDLPVVLVPDAGFDLPDHTRVFYHVNSGDDIDALAEHFQVRRNQLVLWNDLDPDATLRSGMTLQLFLAVDFDLSQSFVQTEEQARAVIIGSAEHEAHRKGSGKKSSGGGSSVHYKVKRGDTVGGIAKRHGVSSSDIIRWNNLDKKATIRTGMRLVIHKKSSKKSRKKKRSKKKRKKK